MVCLKLYVKKNIKGGLMKIKLNFIYNSIIIFLIFLLIFGYQLNKKSSSSKKNEISNLTQQIISKNNHLFLQQENIKIVTLYNFYFNDSC